MNFDRLVRQILCEQNEGELNFYDHVFLLLKVLKAKGFIEPTIDLKNLATKALKQRKFIVTIDDETLPSIILHFSFVDGNFSVEAIDPEKPSERKTFTNTFSETIFKDVANYLKDLQIKYLKKKDDVQPETFGQEEENESQLPK